MITSGLKSQKLIWIIFSIRNHRDSILSSNPGSVNFQEISFTQINDAVISKILPVFTNL